MKKVLVLIWVILFFGVVSGLSIDTEKDVFSKGETFMATLEGNILEPISKSDVSFNRGHVQIPLEYDIVKLEDKHYIYAILQYNAEDLNLEIEDVYFKENNEIKTENLIKNFSVGNTTADFYVRPGFVSVSDDFEIEFYNNLNSEIDIEYSLANVSKSVSVRAQEGEDVGIDTSGIFSTGVYFMEVSSGDTSYSVPVYFVASETEQEFPDEPVTDDARIRFDLDEIQAELKKDERNIFAVNLKNTGGEIAEEIVVYVEGIEGVELNVNDIGSLGVGEEVEIEISIEQGDVGEFSGIVVAEGLNTSDEILLNIKVGGENVVPSSSVKGEKSCSELGGQKCTTCYGYNVPSSEGLCCIGSCEPEAENEGINWWAIGIVSLILVGIFLFLWLRMRKTKGASSGDILKKKAGLNPPR